MLGPIHGHHGPLPSAFGHPDTENDRKGAHQDHPCTESAHAHTLVETVQPETLLHRAKAMREKSVRFTFEG